MQKQEEYLVEFGEVLGVKLHSFYFYLALLNHKRLAQWIVINQLVQEQHPLGMSLLDLQSLNSKEQIVEDEVFKRLMPQHSAKFLILTQKDLTQLNIRQIEYRDLMKKGAMLRYMMANLHTKNIRDILGVHVFLVKFNQVLKKKHGANYKKVADWETCGKDIVQIFAIKHLINVHLKHSSEQEGHQEEALKSAQLLSVILYQFLYKCIGLQAVHDGLLETVNKYYQESDKDVPEKVVNGFKDEF